MWLRSDKITAEIFSSGFSMLCHIYWTTIISKLICNIVRKPFMTTCLPIFLLNLAFQHFQNSGIFLFRECSSKASKCASSQVTLLTHASLTAAYYLVLTEHLMWSIVPQKAYPHLNICCARKSILALMYLILRCSMLSEHYTRNSRYGFNFGIM